MDDKARLFQALGNKLGWDIPEDKFLERVEQLDNGLVNEDEFIYLLQWFDKCRIVNKLNQDLVTGKNTESYKVPDVLAIFEDNDGKEHKFLIEIKTSKKNKLSWTEKYYDGLLNYSKSLGIPLLVAWKWTEFPLWTLFAIDEFEKPVSNYKIDFSKAHKKNLLSRLCGDGLVKANENFEFNLVITRQQSEKVNEETSKVTGIITDIFVIDRDGNKNRNIDKSLSAYILSLNYDEVSFVTDKEIILRYKPLESSVTFIQKIILNYTTFFIDSNDVNWYKKTMNQENIISCDELYDGLLRHCHETKILDYFFQIEPSPD